jgi:hypothetical protein
VDALKPCWLLMAFEEKVPVEARLASDSGWTKDRPRYQWARSREQTKPLHLLLWDLYS